MIGIILPANNPIGLPETGLQKLSFCRVKSKENVTESGWWVQMKMLL